MQTAENAEVAEVHINHVTAEIVDAAIKVHKRLGPGLLESAYKACLAFELRKRGFIVDEEVPVTLQYDALRAENAYRMDMLLQKCVVVETKAITKTIPLHEAQLLSHLNLTGHQVGLLINFHVLRLKDGIKRLVNGLKEADDWTENRELQQQRDA